MDRLTIDEAIEHAREVAKKERDKLLKVGDEYICSECGKEHEQLAEWLEELKDYRRFNGAKTFDNGFKQGEKYGYKKAIDDFADKISTYGTYDDYGNVIDVLEIAEGLKKECAE